MRRNESKKSPNKNKIIAKQQTIETTSSSDLDSKSKGETVSEDHQVMKRVDRAFKDLNFMYLDQF